MREDHALRVAGGAGGEEHRRGVGRVALGDFGLEVGRVAAEGFEAELGQLVAAHELRLRVVAQAARLVEVDALQRRALRQDLQQLVDLLLVLCQRVRDPGVVDRKRHLGRHRILVQGHRNAAQALGRAHGRIDARPVGAHQREMVAALEPVRGETAGERAHFVGEAVPAPGLPDAEILLANRGTLRPHLGVVQQQLRKRIQAGQIFRHLFPPLGLLRIL